jgi:hypothetical protein
VGAGFSRHGRAEGPPPHVMLEILMHQRVRHKARGGLFRKSGTGSQTCHVARIAVPFPRADFISKNPPLSSALSLML